MARQPDETLDRLLTRTLRSHAAGDEVCPSAEDVAAYLERSLDSEEARRIELHLSSCARCAETLATLIETEPVPSSAPASVAWWSWRTWRWAVPATAVLVVGIWFASALREERTTTAPQMAQYKEAVPPEQAAAAKKTAAPADAREPSASPQSTSVDGTPESAAQRLQVRQVPAQPGEAKQQSSGVPERDAAAANAAGARPSPPTGFAPEPPAEFAKNEDSRADVASGDLRRERNAGVEGRTMPAAPAPAAVPAPPVAAPAAAEKAADARAQNAAAADTARAATSSVSAPAPSAPKLAELSQGQGQTQGGASAAFSASAPLLLRARGGNVMWRISGPVIEQSTNGGAAWTTEFRAANVVSAGVVAADDTVWLVGSGGLVLRRPATGGWRVVPAPVMDNLVSVSDAGATSVTVRSANGRQFQTRDAGVTWTTR